MSADGRRKRIGSLGGKVTLGFICFPPAEQVVDLGHGGGEIFDLQYPLVDELANEMPANAYLDAKVVQRCASQRALGIPLNVDRCVLKLLMPVVAGPMCLRFVGSKDRLAEGFFPTLAGDR